MSIKASSLSLDALEAKHSEDFRLFQALLSDRLLDPKKEEALRQRVYAFHSRSVPMPSQDAPLDDPDLLDSQKQLATIEQLKEMVAEVETGVDASGQPKKIVKS